ncbi:hypothetical protein BZB76_5649 [Actinomadura pelletieri DSM 43383]|uniref:Uncharacterized protein n=1 Tax=Actinomadura pelletieri DSM 43383 TaxID=1120940 RepID=A0A495QHB9_9ACTN|nr:hypothetical protein BZB76_5649 [Actinomadura pelletieri DSM 43383]
MNPSRWLVPALVAKAALVGLLGLAVAFPEWDRFADKAMGARAVAYPAAALLVALIWAVRGRAKPFPWDVDLLVTAPFVIDVAGNAVDLYDSVGWFDDACHFGNWALLCAAAGIALRRWGGLRSWKLAVCCAGIGAAAAIVWEVAEYGLFILDTPEATTAYRDTIGDLVLGLTGAVVAGVAVAAAPTRSVDQRLDVVPGDLLDERRGSGDADAGQDVVRSDVAAGRALRAEGDLARGEDHGEQVVQGSGVRQ